MIIIERSWTKKMNIKENDTMNHLSQYSDSTEMPFALHTHTHKLSHHFAPLSLSILSHLKCMLTKTVSKVCQLNYSNVIPNTRYWNQHNGISTDCPFSFWQNKNVFCLIMYVAIIYLLIQCLLMDFNQIDDSYSKYTIA